MMNDDTLNILLIEDNPGDVALIREYLKDFHKTGFHLKSAKSLSEGKKILQENQFKVILLDLGLSDSQGLETLLNLQEEVSSTPIIILTGLSDEDLGEKAVGLGAQDYLVKGEIDSKILYRSIHYAIQRFKYEQDIKASLKEKEVLLREIHHRVKNNMQIIISILNLQLDYLKDDKDKELFIECQERVKSMAIVHEKLYQSPNLSQIDFSDYVKTLASRIFTAYNVNSNIKLIVKMKNEPLGIETAIPCGLILNELLSNAIKHAFRNTEKGEIRIELESSPNKYKLIFSDNGVGFPEDIDYKHTETLGLQMVITLVNQIEGSIKLDTSKGTKFTIIFQPPNYPDRW